MSIENKGEIYPDEETRKVGQVWKNPKTGEEIPYDDPEFAAKVQESLANNQQD